MEPVRAVPVVVMEHSTTQSVTVIDEQLEVVLEVAVLVAVSVFVGSEVSDGDGDGEGSLESGAVPLSGGDAQLFRNGIGMHGKENVGSVGNVGKVYTTAGRGIGNQMMIGWPLGPTSSGTTVVDPAALVVVTHSSAEMVEVTMVLKEKPDGADVTVAVAPVALVVWPSEADDAVLGGVQGSVMPPITTPLAAYETVCPSTTVSEPPWVRVTDPSMTTTEDWLGSWEAVMVTPPAVKVARVPELPVFELPVLELPVLELPVSESVRGWVAVPTTTPPGAYETVWPSTTVSEPPWVRVADPSMTTTEVWLGSWEAVMVIPAAVKVVRVPTLSVLEVVRGSVVRGSVVLPTTMPPGANEMVWPSTTVSELPCVRVIDPSITTTEVWLGSWEAVMVMPPAVRVARVPTTAPVVVVAALSVVDVSVVDVSVVDVSGALQASVVPSMTTPLGASEKVWSSMIVAEPPAVKVIEPSITANDDELGS